METIIKKYDDSNQYKEAIMSDAITSETIRDNITMPEFVYKYRSFNDKNWKDLMNGNFYFSTPDNFNKNDNNDCLVKYDMNSIINEIIKLYNINPSQINKARKKKIKSMFKNYADSLRKPLKIGCFTTADPTQRDMWDDKVFGDCGNGFCIKYKVDKEYFFPDNIIFLKVLYEATLYDSTQELCYLIRSKGMNKDSPYTGKVVCLVYNHILIKHSDYKAEKEWRIIVPENRWSEYFDKEGIDTKNISKQMVSIYLGKDYKDVDSADEKYYCALNVCKKLNIPLYHMIEEKNGVLKEECIFNPDMANTDLNSD